MFAYSDPSRDLLKSIKALTNYRNILHAQYVRAGTTPNSAFTLLEAFDGLGAGAKSVDTVTWIAFPKSQPGTPAQIDADRFRMQDEYVEWRVEKNAQGRVTRITFVTDFREYYQAVAEVGFDALVTAIRAIRPAANPKVTELYGAGFDPASESATARGQAFLGNLRQNPWNNGTKEILCLTLGANSLSALFGLVGPCAIEKANMAAGAVCGTLGNACAPGRNSDPNICEAAQSSVRQKRGLSLADPVGIRILRLTGIWKINGKQIDINDQTQNKGAWTISPSGRRAVLKVVPGLTMGDDPITTGAQVATKVEVGAAVISAAEVDLPQWSRVGQETSRALEEVATAAGGGD